MKMLTIQTKIVRTYSSTNPESRTEDDEAHSVNPLSITGLQEDRRACRCNISAHVTQSRRIFVPRCNAKLQNPECKRTSFR